MVCARSVRMECLENKMKVVINVCYGGFGLSREGILLGRELSGDKLWGGENDYGSVNVDRNDPILIQVVETLGEKANGRYSELRVVEIPDDIKWQVEEYDGSEWIAEAHRIFGRD